ncbi:nuclear transport factor 2 family protein [Pelomonas sp. KK5]|uniref:nuclear transport factor 2 family protein n=1 Tax=Pelomonas sp. KK5 TaxID=1855730 RepID=UPI00097C4457|nr:nuclear transport factor 2 family protein [Pelomonas sp. KK5]
MPIQQNTTPEARAVEQALAGWHIALEHHDWTAVANGLAPGFLMIEHDRILDKAELLAFVTGSARLGRQRAALHGFRTEVLRDCAWTTVQNDEIWIANDGRVTPFSFLETAVFRLEGGAWLIDRYHATRVAPQATTSPASV